MVQCCGLRIFAIVQVPTEFQSALATLQSAEAFVQLCASGQVDKVRKALERDWDLINAIDRDGA